MVKSHRFAFRLNEPCGGSLGSACLFVLLELWMDCGASGGLFGFYFWNLPSTCKTTTDAMKISDIASTVVGPLQAFHKIETKLQSQHPCSLAETTTTKTQRKSTHILNPGASSW